MSEPIILNNGTADLTDVGGQIDQPPSEQDLLDEVARLTRKLELAPKRSAKAKEGVRRRTANYREKRAEAWQTLKELGLPVIKNEPIAETENRVATGLRRRDGVTLPGEIIGEPGTDVRNIQEATESALAWLKAMNLPGHQAGESLADLERRVWDGYFKNGKPFLNKWGNLVQAGAAVTPERTFEKGWVLLPGSDQPLTLEPTEVLHGIS